MYIIDKVIKKNRITFFDTFCRLSSYIDHIISNMINTPHVVCRLSFPKCKLSVLLHKR